jgi:hypothetical protein
MTVVIVVLLNAPFVAGFCWLHAKAYKQPMPKQIPIVFEDHSK